MTFSAVFIVGGGGGESICCTDSFCCSNKPPPPPSNLTLWDGIHTLACYHSPSVACGIPLVSCVSPSFASLQGRSTPKQQCSGNVTSLCCLRTHQASVHILRSNCCLQWNMSPQGSLVSKAHTEKWIHLKQRHPHAWHVDDLDKMTPHKESRGGPMMERPMTSQPPPWQIGL